MAERAAREASTDIASSRPVPELVRSVLSEPGQPLDTATREGFSGRFGFDFRDVQVHIAPDQFTPFGGESLDRILRPGVVTVVVFTAPTCTPCHLLMRLLSDQAADRAKSGVKIQYVSVDNSEPGNEKISARYNAVKSTPQVYIFIGASVHYHDDQVRPRDEYPKIFAPILAEAA